MRNFTYILLFSIVLSALNIKSLNGQDILFVGGGTVDASIESDSMLIDSLRSWGYQVHYLYDLDYMSMSEDVYDGMDAVFFNESVGASNVRNFGAYRDSFPLPSVILDAGALENHDNRWDMFTPDGGVLVHDPADSIDFVMQVSNTSHYITENYKQDTVVKWSNTNSYDLVPYIHGLKYDMTPLAIPLAPLESPNAFTMGVLDDNDFPNRMFYYGITHRFIHDGNDIQATQHFFNFIKRGVNWILDIGDPVCDAAFDFEVLEESQIPGGVTFQFHDSSSASSDIIDWQWDFGDDDSSQVQHPVKSYAFAHQSPDSFLVKLTIQTSKGCISDTSRYVNVGHLRPECDAMFTFHQDTEKNTSYYQFENTSESDSIIHQNWSFGNQMGSDTTAPYQYLGIIPGDSVEVCLSIETISGCLDTICQYVTYEPNDEVKNILLVGNGTVPSENNFDQAVMDSLSEWGYAPAYIRDSLFNLQMTGDLNDNIDGIFLSATTDENTLQSFAAENYPVPCVNLNMGTLKAGQWDWINSNATELHLTTNNPVDNRSVAIQDHTHYITAWTEQEVIQWSNIEDGSSILENLPLSVREVNINYSGKLASLKSIDETGTWNMLTVDSTDDDGGLPNKMFVWGLDADGLQGVNNDGHYASTDCWKLLNRATDWIYNTVDYTPPVGINRVTPGYNETIRVYPNPAKNWMHIHISSENKKKGQIVITDISGKQVESMSFSIKGGAFYHSVNVSDYPTGVYLINVSVGDHIYHKKLMIE